MAGSNDKFRISDPSPLPGRALAVGLAGLALSGIGFLLDSGQFFFSWLTAFTFWVTIALGALFFVMLHHLVDACWSIVIRRICETLMKTLPLMLLFFLPVALGMHELYHWTHQEAVASDPLLQAKSGYLNVGFFLVRSAFYFAVWWFLSGMLYGISLKQDKGFDPGQVKRFRLLSAPGMILFALTATFASFDWLMSLDPHWYSTIFGVYVFAGSFLGALSLLILAALYLRARGQLVQTVTVEHYHDLGKLLFAFTIFWAYISFSQYFLIWYANIPEETVWFLHRWEGGWKHISLIILFGHFIIPFLLLMLRAVKRSLKALMLISIWLLLMHWIDLYWIIQPIRHPHGAHLSWMDLTAMLGIGGIFIWHFWRRLAGGNLVPVNDPRLTKSIEFRND